MHLSQYIAARMLEADLAAADAHFTSIGLTDMSGFTFLKNALVSIANVVDFERTVRSIYKDNPLLSEEFRRESKNFDFAKYLRNKLVGHIHPELIDKAIEWKPELNYMAAHMSEKKIMEAVNFFLLETAINTYVGEDGRHRIFDSDTDLMYPPDFQRFMLYLESTVRGALSFLSRVCSAIGASLEYPKGSTWDLELWIKSADTTFAYLKKV